VQTFNANVESLTFIGFIQRGRGVVATLPTLRPEGPRKEGAPKSWKNIRCN